ncbi:hypothetical protein TNCV_4866291 [Trichonephila clavipes]|nr:hypothetical protein TNCV_4866291 [Trichonephila clavipes]
MIVQFRNEKVSNHGSIPITIDCNVVAFIVFEEGFHQSMKRTQQEARECVDDGRPGHPQTFRIPENIEKVSAALCLNRLQTIAKPVGISSAPCSRIPTKDLTMHKVCQLIVPCKLNEDQSADEVDCIAR